MQIMESQVLFHLRQHGEGLPRVLLQLLLCSTASCFHLAQSKLRSPSGSMAVSPEPALHRS